MPMPAADGRTTRSERCSGPKPAVTALRATTIPSKATHTYLVFMGSAFNMASSALPVAIERGGHHWRMAESAHGGEVDSGGRTVPVLPGPGRSLVGFQPVEHCGLDSTDAMHHRHF